MGGSISVIFALGVLLPVFLLGRKFLLGRGGGTIILLGGRRRGAVVGSLPGSQACGAVVGSRNLLGLT